MITLTYIHTYILTYLHSYLHTYMHACSDDKEEAARAVAECESTEANKVMAHPLAKQNAFLIEMGIRNLLEMYLSSLDEEKDEDRDKIVNLISAYERLVDPEQMGDLFKFWCVSQALPEPEQEGVEADHTTTTTTTTGAGAGAGVGVETLPDGSDGKVLNVGGENDNDNVGDGDEAVSLTGLPPGFVHTRYLQTDSSGSEGGDGDGAEVSNN
jgi:hypothetical protein